MALFARCMYRSKVWATLWLKDAQGEYSQVGFSPIRSNFGAGILRGGYKPALLLEFALTYLRGCCLWSRDKECVIMIEFENWRQLAPVDV